MWPHGSGGQEGLSVTPWPVGLTQPQSRAQLLPLPGLSAQT